MKLSREATAIWSRVRESARDIKAVWPQVRRPAIRLLVGGGLLVPAAVMMAGSRAETRPEAQTRAEALSIPRVLATETGDTGGFRAIDSRLIAAMDKWTDRDVAPPVAAREEAPIWANALEPAAESETAEATGPIGVVALFAREFKIPVKLASQIHAAALAEKIKPRIAFGLVKAESSFRTHAVSPVGAIGLTQLLPSTARWLVPGTTRGDLMTAETNLRVGFRYLRRLINEFDGNEKLALTAYNRGPGTVSKLLKRGRDPDNGYAEKVMTGNSSRHVRLMNAKFGRGRG